MDIDIEKFKAMIAKAESTSNPALLEFPTDKWGFTSGIKKEVLRVASTIRGKDDKHAILVQTMAVLAAHIKGRLQLDKAHAEARAEALAKLEAERLPRERTTGRAIPSEGRIVVNMERTNG